MEAAPVVRKPAWLRRASAFQGKQAAVSRWLAAAGLHTVCKEACCPNRSECFSQGTATFLVMGTVCTRTCAFCSVSKGGVSPLDWNEIPRLLGVAATMKLRHVVITSVTRDDLDDGGASFFAELIAAFRKQLPSVTVEVLVPDFKGAETAIAAVCAAQPAIFNHNMETVRSLYPILRPQADYRRSLTVLEHAASLGCITKSGIMAGFGETPDHVEIVMQDLRRANCSILTIGQYLQPSPEQIPVKEYVTPEQFERYRAKGIDMGFLDVVAGPFVRSSYHAAKTAEKIANNP